MTYRVVEENLRAAMSCYARVSENGEVREYPGISVSFCGLACAVFNSAMLNAPAAETELERLITMAGVHFQQREVGWTLWLCDDLVSSRVRNRGRSLANAAGMELIAQPPGMYAERLEEPRRQVAELRILPVGDEATRLDFAHLSSVIFSLPFHTARAIYASPGLWSSPMSGWVGYFRGQAVCIVCVVVAAGVAGVYSVGTLPAFQGRGFAETIIRYGLSQAREVTGTEATVLQSTMQGLNLYSRMGYRTVTRFGVYISESWRRN